jgi:hypothetical protein
MATRVAHGIQSSPFLPALPPVALGNLGRVVNPGTFNPDGGLVSLGERLDHRPTPAEGPSTYTRQPVPNREGGIFPTATLSAAGYPTRAYHRR